MNEPFSSYDQVTPRPGPSVVVGAASVCVLAVLATWLPLYSGSISGDNSALADSGADLIVYVVAGIVVLAIGAMGLPDRPSGGGLVAGVAAVFTGFFGYFASLLLWTPSGGDGLGVDRGVAFYPMILVPVAGVAAIIASGRASVSGSVDRRVRHPYAGIGIVASVAVIVGAMLPPLDSRIGFAERNFEHGVWYAQTAYLVFVASLGLAGVVGFAHQTRWGLGLAAGAFVPTAWLLLTTIGEDNAGDEFRSGNEPFHPTFTIAIVAQAIALVLGTVVHSANRTRGHAPWHPPAPTVGLPPPPPSPPPPTP